MSYFKYAEELIDNYGKKYSGISYNIPDFSKYENEYISYIIRPETEYRSDKIAFEIWGNDQLSWVLDEINNVTHPSFYTVNKEIYYLPLIILFNLGVEI